MDISVVIVNYNTRDRLLACLATLEPELRGLASEILVVDNGSGDGSAEAVRREFPQVRVIANADNRGFSRANNQALRQAQGDDVLLLNPDTEVRPGSVATLRIALHELPGAVGVGPKVVRPDGRLDLACRRSFPRPSVALARLLGLGRLFPRSRWLARYNLTFQDPDLAAIQFFDEAFFMYGEDLDLCFRLKERGGRIYYVPDAVVLHYKGQSSVQRPKLMLREFHKAMWTFYRKHYAGGWRVLFVPLVWSGIKLRYGFIVGLNAARGRQVVSP